MIRILCDIGLLLSVFLLPSYVTFVLVLFCILFLGNFVESIVFGFLLDLLYGGGGFFNINVFYFFTALIFIFYILSIKLKKILRLSL